MNKIFAPFLPPWVETGLQPAFYDMESGTVLQQTARMYAKVQQLTRLFNELSEETKTEVENFEHSVNETVSEYIEKFTQLKDFVEDYFDNLDVQEEINNKLDAMVEDGTLQEIIDNYLQPKVTWTFDTVADMVASTNLIDGTYAKTLGYESIDDGEGAYYYINSTSGEITISEGLYAKLLYKYDTNYYDEVTVKSEVLRDDHGNFKSIYYIAEIPTKDKFGDPIDLHVVGNDNLRPSEYAQKYNSTLTTNASLAWETSPDVWQDGIVIGDGVVLHDYDGSNYPADYGAYLGIKDNNVIQMYPKNTTSAQMLADGVKQCVFCFGNIVTNSQVNEGAYNVDQGTMSFAVGQKADGTIVLFGNEGRDLASYGLTVREVAQLMIDAGCVNAWELDGGGSFSMSYHGTKLNRDLDHSRTQERKISYLFNVQHTIKNLRVAEDNSTQGKIAHIKDKMTQAQFRETEKRHEYVKFRLPQQYLLSNQYGTQKVVMSASSPYNVDSDRIKIQYDENNKPVGVVFFAPCYYKVQFNIQAENKDNSSNRSIYCAIYVDNNEEYKWSTRLSAGEYKSVTIDYLGQYIGDVGKEVSIRVWGGVTADDQISIERGVGYYEIIPISQTY